ncbi:MAG: GAF domain-containing protein [Gemmatimonadota bacterium]
MASVLDAERIVAGLRGLFAKNAGRHALLQYTADRMQAAGSPYTSVYMYMLHGRELRLEAFAGRETEHVNIAVGDGVCGTAVATGQDQNVPDVRAVGNYIACNTYTRSELVILVRRGTLVLGQIDVDSDVPDPFTTAEETAVRKIADGLASLL